MRAVIQRVTQASVQVAGDTVGRIAKGLVVLLAVARDDTDADARYLAEKVAALRIFDDAEGKMNLSVNDVGGGLLVISQFTLFGDVRRGLRPSWVEAAPPEVAQQLYESFVAIARESVEQVETGSFRANMQVALINDGPVTILLDSRKLF